jgi:hypothetical protein
MKNSSAGRLYFIFEKCRFRFRKYTQFLEGSTNDEDVKYIHGRWEVQMLIFRKCKVPLCYKNNEIVHKIRKYKKMSLESTNDDEDKYKYLLFGSA